MQKKAKNTQVLSWEGGGGTWTHTFRGRGRAPLAIQDYVQGDKMCARAPPECAAKQRRAPPAGALLPLCRRRLRNRFDTRRAFTGKGGVRALLTRSHKTYQAPTRAPCCGGGGGKKSAPASASHALCRQACACKCWLLYTGGGTHWQAAQLELNRTQSARGSCAPPPKKSQPLTPTPPHPKMKRDAM